MQVLPSKYKVDGDWLRRERLKYASHSWKAIEKMRNIVSKGACFLVGDGE